MYSAVREHAADSVRARVSDGWMFESVHGGRPTYVPSVLLPPQMAIAV